MNAVTNFKSDLRPLPMRISQLQFDRLRAVRARDGLAIQEHVRRALDFYLGKVERDLMKNPVNLAELDALRANPVPEQTPVAELPGFISSAPMTGPTTGVASMPTRKGPPRIRNR